MAYDFIGTFSHTAGATLTASVLDSAGVALGSQPAYTIVETGGGGYFYHTAAMPDSHLGVVHILDGATFVSDVTVSPRESENADVKTSTRMATFTLPTNFSTLGINASGHVSRVVLADTLTAYTGNTPQTGDAFARIGLAGVGLTNLGDVRVAFLDASILSRMATFSYTAPPSAAAIDTQLSGVHGAGAWGGGGGVTGPGADQVTITITRAITLTPIADADVWITTDAAGSNTIAGTLQTDSSGDALFLLDAGDTYYLWMSKDGENSINGQSFVAVAD